MGKPPKYDSLDLFPDLFPGCCDEMANPRLFLGMDAAVLTPYSMGSRSEFCSWRNLLALDHVVLDRVCEPCFASVASVVMEWSWVQFPVQHDCNVSQCAFGRRCTFHLCIVHESAHQQCCNPVPGSCAKSLQFGTSALLQWRLSCSVGLQIQTSMLHHITTLALVACSRCELCHLTMCCGWSHH